MVEHIGCHYAKIFPKSGIGGSEFPYVLAGMVESWGGECVDYPERRHCCGFGFRNYLVQANRGYSIANSHKKLESMAPYKPDFIVANCPGCAMFLDKWQYAIAEMEGTTYGENGHGIPVLTYEEMAGLVLGYDPWVLGMQMHQVDVEPLLDKMGVEYDPAAKYLGRNGNISVNPRRPWSIAARRTQYTTSENNEASCSHRRRRSGHADGPAPRRTGRRARNHRKEAELGGKLRGWHVLFPSFTPASEILTELRRRIAERGIEVMTRTEARGFSREGVQLPDGRMLACDSVVVCSGFTLFDASIKEEYGYGIYDNVFTTVDIERMLNEGRVARADGSRPKRIAFLHCVGSRDEKVCQQHCSKVCCITGVKQAMEMRQMFPEADVFNFTWISACSAPVTRRCTARHSRNTTFISSAGVFRRRAR